MIASESLAPRHGGDSLRSLNLTPPCANAPHDTLNMGKVQRGLSGTGCSSPTELIVLSYSVTTVVLHNSDTMGRSIAYAL